MTFANVERSAMGELRWLLTPTYVPTAADMRIPIHTEDARAILRGDARPTTVSGRVDRPGTWPDIVDVGFACLYAVSPRFAACLAGSSGWALVPFVLDGRARGYSLLTVHGRCSRVLYARSEVLSRSPHGFVRLRGLVLEDGRSSTDLALPPNRDSILVSDAVADHLSGADLTGLCLRSMADVELDVPERFLVDPTPSPGRAA